MKLTSVEIHPDNSSEIAILSFRDPGSINPYNVKSISGLDAESITPKYYSGSGSSVFYSMSLENREIVILVGLNPRVNEYKSYSDLRDSLYKTISSSRVGKIQLQFKNGTDVVAVISGFVTKIESPLFEKTQSVQITVQCDEPMLKAVDIITLIPNPGVLSKHVVVSDDMSTAPHGFSFDVKLLINVAFVRIVDPDDDGWFFEVWPTGGFLSNDILRFSSEYNNKTLQLIRSGAGIGLSDVVIAGSTWPIIFPGNNRFMFNTDELEWVSLSYYPTYWGV